MHEKHWEWTILDTIHKPVAEQTALWQDEYPIISFCAGADDWTLMTTHRMVGAADARRTEIQRDEFGTMDFGDFKQDVDSPRITRATVTIRGETKAFLYESGYASMVPIYYFRFWTLKWPAWRETYRLSREQGMAEPSASPKGGRAKRLSDSGVGGGPPSVS